jgi:predicted nucleotidyltransferase
VDLSARNELRPIADALAMVHESAKRVGVPWFVVGATARDLILSFGYGMQTGRMTRDVDIAVNVSSWSDYRALSAALLEHHEVRRDQIIVHRFYFGTLVMIDVVPFGAISSDGTIRWPNDEEREMNVLGFLEASRATIDIRLPGPLIASVVSIPGLVLLKFIAWADRHNELPRHDSVDIREFLLSYSEGWNLDRLYEEASEFLAAHHFNPVLGGAALLGRDVRGLAEKRTEAFVTEMLARETNEEGDLRLASDMGRDVKENLQLLKAFRAGFDSGAAR